MNDARRTWTPLLAIAAGLVGAPALWFAQMLVSETLASTACYPLGVAQAAPRWAHVGVWLALIAAGAFALAAACATWLTRARRPGTRNGNEASEISAMDCKAPRKR
ncbi:hypothetical protein QM306_10150 [Burkholderia cenocepacia]|nr:hypothetical protein [Burkholderia cenocepacia]